MNKNFMGMLRWPSYFTLVSVMFTTQWDYAHSAMLDSYYQPNTCNIMYANYANKLKHDIFLSNNEEY